MSAANGLISIREYARSLNIDEKAVRRARDAGLLGDGYDNVTGKIHPEKATANWGYRHQVVKPAGGISRQKAIEKLEHKRDQLTALEPDYDVKTLISSITITGDMSAAEAMRINEVIDAALNLIKLQQADGLLVRKADVDKELFALGKEMNKKLIAIPDRIADDILAANGKIEVIKIITEAINEVIDDMTNGISD